MPERRRRCAQCGSTRFRLLAAQLVCAAGHIQRDFRVEAAHDEDGFGTQITTRARTVHRASQREAAHAERRRRQLHARRVARGRTPLVVPGSAEHAALDDRDSAYLYGPRATFALVEAFQLMLRAQIAAVQQLYHVEIEGAAREVWALHVSSASLPAAPYDAARREKRASPPRPMYRVGRQRYVDDAPRAHLETVSLRSTVAVVYLALVLRRVPVTLGELREYAGSLPFLHAARRLPAALVDSLSYSDLSYAGLDSEVVPSVMELHRRAGDIATRLHLDNGLVFPEVNAAPILQRLVHRMLLPAPMYVGAKALLSFLHIDMHVRNVSVKLPRARSRSRDSDTSDAEGEPSVTSYSRNAAIPRCVMLMAALLVMAKLQWGLDGQPRSAAPRELHGAVAHAGAPPFHAWLETLQTSVANGPFCPWDTETDVLGLSDTQVDAYLDFFEKEFAAGHVPSSMSHARRDGIADLLSFGDERGQGAVDRAAIRAEQRARHAALRAALYAAPAHDAGTLEAGEAYPVYAHDPSGTLPRDFLHVVHAANRVLGLDTGPVPQFQGTEVKHARDQEILLDTVMQLDEALLMTLQRKRNARGK